MNPFDLSKSRHRLDDLPVADSGGSNRRTAWDRLSASFNAVFEAQLERRIDVDDTLAELIHQSISFGEVMGADVESAYRRKMEPSG